MKINFPRACANLYIRNFKCQNLKQVFKILRLRFSMFMHTINQIKYKKYKYNKQIKMRIRF